MIFVIKKKIVKKLKEFKKNYSYVRFYNNQDPVIYLNLKHKTKVRTYLNLFFRIRAVYNEPIVIEFSLLRMVFLARWFKDLDYIYFSKPFSKLNKVKVFSHNKKADFNVNYNFKKVYSSVDFNKNALPYIMHPNNYLSKEAQIMEKKVGILMSGNFDKKIYDTNIISKNFGMMNRWDVYQEILKHSALLSIYGTDLLENLDSGKFKDKFVLMKWQTGAIPIEKWRDYLSSADFIFCAPGMTMPMCHNVLEAMSVGVIPILNYSNWLNPSLEDGVNCLEYSNSSNIAKVIDTALSLPEEKKQILRENTIAYFKKYYDLYDFKKNSSNELVVLNENISDLI
ncbi:ATPase [Flavobacterium sp.]|uniref:ATPase n=1 Tax=Flavobacterium sp. TaxID=239 RepID=UPI0031D5CB49